MDQSLQALRDLVSEPSQNFAAVGTAISIVVVFVILIALVLIAAALPQRTSRQKSAPEAIDETPHDGSLPFLPGRRYSRIPRWAVVTLLLGLVGAGVAGAVVLWYDTTSANEYCTSTCHSMAGPSGTWLASAHANVDCIRCHEGIKWESWPQGVVGRTQSLYYQATGSRAPSRPVDEDTCLDCHGGLLDTPLRARNGDVFTHGTYLRQDRTCLSCHGAQGHIPAR